MLVIHLIFFECSTVQEAWSGGDEVSCREVKITKRHRDPPVTT